MRLRSANEQTGGLDMLCDYCYVVIMFEYDTNPLLAESAFRLGLNWICVRESPHKATDDPEDQKYTESAAKDGGHEQGAREIQLKRISN